MLDPILAVRVTHSGLYADGRPNVQSVLINDLDTGQQHQNRKVPVYVPVGGFIDIPLTSNSLFSVNQGTISKLAEAGLVTVQVLDPSGGVGQVQIVDGRSVSDFENGTWDYPWKTIQKAINSLWGNPDDVTPAPPTLPRDPRVVQIMAGNYDEDVVLPPAGSLTIATFGNVGIGTPTSPRNLTRIVNPTVNPDAPLVPVLVLEGQASSWAVWGNFVIGNTGGAQAQNVILTRGLIVGNFDGSGQTTDWNLLLNDLDIVSPVFNAPTGRLLSQFTLFSGGTPTFGRLSQCIHNDFLTGFTTTVAPLASMVMIDTRVAGTVTSPNDLPVDYLTNGYFAANAVVKAGGWLATIPVGRTIPY